MCGLYDIRPAYFGLANYLVTIANHFGNETQIYNGFDLSPPPQNSWVADPQS